MPHVMERPDRVIVDLPEVAFHLPAENGRKQEGLIASFRYGLFAPGPLAGRDGSRPAGRRLRASTVETDAAGRRRRS